MTALGRDYFHFDPAAHRLYGERSGRRYEIGGRLNVRVVRVDLDEAKIDLELVGQGAGGKGKRKTRRKTRRVKGKKSRS